MNVILTCGGTGGHITPALAIAHILREELPDVRIIFVGTEKGMENSIVTNAGYPIRQLRLCGFSRKSPISAVRAIVLAERGIREAKKLFKEFPPDFVIGTGGYACYPTLKAAASVGIPCAVHESNAVPGLAVRMLAPYVDRIWLNFESAGDSIRQKGKLLTVGNPVFSGPRVSAVNLLRRGILSFGGSLGAESVNCAILDLMEAEVEELGHPFHVHATGKRGYEAFMNEFSRRGLREDMGFEVLPFISNMPDRMRSAKVVICRAGAMSISEVCFFGRASILIPSPNVAENHQYRNALEMERQGAAVLLPEEKLSGESLRETAFSLLRDEKKRKKMEAAALAFSRPAANRLIMEDIRRIIGEKDRG